jgi:hypothetical protein
MTDDHKPTTGDKIKKHFRDHKTPYLVVGTVVVTAAVTVLVMKRVEASTASSASTVVKQINIASNPITHIVNQNLARKGHPGRIVYWLEGDETFSSITDAAKAAGVNRAELSKYLRGLAANVKENHFRDLGDMI